MPMWFCNINIYLGEDSFSIYGISWTLNWLFDSSWRRKMCVCSPIDTLIVAKESISGKSSAIEMNVAQHIWKKQWHYENQYRCHCWNELQKIPLSKRNSGHKFSDTKLFRVSIFSWHSRLRFSFFISEFMKYLSYFSFGTKIKWKQKKSSKAKAIQFNFLFVVILYRRDSVVHAIPNFCSKFHWTDVCSDIFSYKSYVHASAPCSFVFFPLKVKCFFFYDLIFIAADWNSEILYEFWKNDLSIWIFINYFSLNTPRAKEETWHCLVAIPSRFR